MSSIEHFIFSLRYSSFLFIAFCILTLLTCVTNAQVSITEVMYNPSGGDKGKEYIEVINSGNSNFDLTSLKLIASGTTKRSIKVHTNGVFGVGDIAVIVADPQAFLDNYPNYGGGVYDTSSYSLLNSGVHNIEIVSLDGRVVGETISSVTYETSLGGNGDGMSIHFDVNGVSFVDDASPGTVGTSLSNLPTVKNKPTLASSYNQKTNQLKENDNSGLKLFIAPEVLFVGAQSVFSFRYKVDSENLYGEWNFGDGAFAVGDTVAHTYLYPGVYTITFAQPKRFSSDTEPVTVKEVNVLQSQITLERIDGDSVKITNPYDFSLDISDWIIRTSTTSFTFPKKSVITSGQQLQIPFSSPPSDVVNLIESSGSIVASYEPPQIREVHTKTVDTPPISQTPTTTDKSKPPTQPSDERQSTYKQQNNKDLSSVNDNMKERIYSVVLWIGLWLVIFIIALFPLLFMKKNIFTRKKK